MRFQKFVDSLLEIYLIGILHISQLRVLLRLRRTRNPDHITWTAASSIGPLRLFIRSRTGVLDLSLHLTGTAGARDVPIGLAHTARVVLDQRAVAGMNSLTLRGVKADTLIIAYRPDPIARRIGDMLNHLAIYNLRAFEILRDFTISDGPATVGTDRAVSSHDEQTYPSTTRHFRHVIDLAAATEAVEPPVEVGQKPLISLIIPVYNASPDFLDDILASFRLQTPGLSELVFSDDASPSPATRAWLTAQRDQPGLQVVLGEWNQGIAGATNAGLSVARGDWIGFLDHDDALAPFAIARIARALATTPGCAFLYTDELIADSKLQPSSYFLKPAWDRVLLSGVNYINHLSIYRRDRLLALGGLRTGYDGSQDYDLVLRYTRDLAPEAICHLPYPAYIWRRSTQTYSAKFLAKATDNARASLALNYGDGHIRIDPAVKPDLHRVRYDLARSDWPPVSVVIPNKNAPDLLAMVLAGLAKTDYPDLEIIVVDNGSTDPRTLDLYRMHQSSDSRFRVVIEERAFNFSHSVNKGIELATGDLMLLLNNDIEVLEPNWLKEMVSCFDFGGVGIVGAKLLYPSRKIQHVGVIAGLGDLAGHWFIDKDADYPGSMGRLWVRQRLSCVTGACFLVSRTCVDAVGPFDEIHFAVAYNDIDYCLRATNAGFQVIWTPFACLIHHESASRGSDETPANKERFEREQANLLRLHATNIFEDRAFNPWYSRRLSDPLPVRRASLPKIR